MACLKSAFAVLLCILREEYIFACCSRSHFRIQSCAFDYEDEIKEVKDEGGKKKRKQLCSSSSPSTKLPPNRAPSSRISCHPSTQPRISSTNPRTHIKHSENTSRHERPPLHMNYCDTRLLSWLSACMSRSM